SSVEKPILTPEQVAGHQMMWAEDNLKDYPYLLINPITGADGSTQIAGPVAYTKSAAVPPALAGLLAITEQDMQEILGSSQQADKMVSNISGKAVEMIQQRLDMQSFIYMSNFAKAMKRSGEIWLSMARDIYVEEGRKMKGLDEESTPTQIKLMEPIVDETGAVRMRNDLSEAKLDVVSEVGPSSSSKRAATVRALTGMMAITQDPQTQQVLTAMAMMNMEGEGISDVRAYFRNQLVRMGVVKPTEQEQQEMMVELQGQQQDPNAVFLQAAAEEAIAKAQRARADVIKTVADAELSQAKTVETLAKVDSTQVKDTLAVLDTVNAQRNPETPPRPVI
ncbi:MAG TPA: portal protein, partial [Burkholderiaceae bacterium]|nr:portal protein [Burkholderiaceae bacterium]